MFRDLLAVPHRIGRFTVPLVFYTNPFEMFLAAALLVQGIVGLAGYPSPSLAEVPFWPRTAYLAVSTFGGGLLMVALALYDPVLPLKGSSRALERAALFVVASGYLGLTGTLLIVNWPRALPVAIVSGLCGVACLFRARAIRRASNVIIKVNSDARNEGRLP